MSGPATLVRDAINAGCSTRRSIAEYTSLDQDLVGAVVDQLLALGLAHALALRTNSPEGDCSGCGSPPGNGCANNPVSVPMSKVH